jgi:magnesium transporter
MIRLYRAGGATCEIHTPEPGQDLGPDVIWLDLVAPTREEELGLEAALRLSIPTREEMQELEASSRVYREGAALYVTADLIHNGDADIPAIDPVTFILTKGPLITIRYFNPRPFSTLEAKLAREPALCDAGPTLFLHLMEAVIDRNSDVLSKTVSRVEAISNHVFAEGRTVGFEKLITKLGRCQIANARLEQSLAGLARVFAFVALDEHLNAHPERREHLKSLGADAQSLIAHNQAVASNINFQLSAALGLINIEQSSIIKIFSVASVAFLPPTLIASIYGMNFDHMPELRWRYGYPFSLALMFVLGGLVVWGFKRMRWI